MDINTIHVQNEGYVCCKSCFFLSQDIIPSADKIYFFSTGVQKLYGDIDSGVWAISYLLSMYKHRRDDFVLFEEPCACINDKTVSLNEVCDYTCYLDKIYPLFSSDDTIESLVKQGLEHQNHFCASDDVKNLFQLDDERFKRPLAGVGNEVFRAMAAIGYSYGKQVFCFPWLSKKRYSYYQPQLMILFEILTKLNKVIIVPTNQK